MYDNKQLQEISTQVRRDILRMVCSAKSGHPGGSMSSTDILFRQKRLILTKIP